MHLRVPINNRAIDNRAVNGGCTVRTVIIRVGAIATMIASGVSMPDPAGAEVGAAGMGRSIDEPGSVLVRFRDTTPRGVRALAHGEAKGHLTRRLAAIGTDVIAVDDVESAIESYRRRNDVVSVEADSTVHALAAPADNRYPLQWNLQPVSNANQGTLNWEPVYPLHQGAGVLVAIVDSGLRSAATGASDGSDGFEPGAVRGDIDFDFINEDTTADDENGHGTHIAGTIAQRTGNPTGTLGEVSVAGVAPRASLLPIKVLDRFGEGTVSDTAAAVLYAADKGAKVINLSLGGNFSATLCSAVASASRTALVVAASGNEAEEGLAPVAYPAACPRAIGIGGLRYDGSRAPYSNAGCELAATGPGGDLSAGGRLFPRNGNQEDPRNGILQESFDPNPSAPSSFGFFFDSGTSMAAAHAAGAAAVLLGINPDVETVRRALLASARDLGTPAADDEYGTGAIDLARAVDLVRSGRVPTPRETLGYRMVATDGGIFSFGDATFLGSTGDLSLVSPIVGMARTVTGKGYWLVAADGGIFSFGDAGFFGSAGGTKLNSPIVGMAATGSGRGYWLVARDGGIFSFGDARFLGSAGGIRLNSPIVGMAADRTGAGYWLVAGDGGIFTFGDADFFGSTGAIRLNRPIVGITPTPTSAGYWLVATDGGIFAFGDAAFFGSTGDIALNKPIVGLTPTCFGRGYWLVANDGGIFSFGTAPFLGSTGDIALNRPIVGMSLAIDHRFDQG